MVSATPAILPLVSNKTLIRQPAIRKLDDTDFSSDLMTTPLSPSKKIRVTFNPHVEEKTIVNEYELKVRAKSLETVRSEVKKAIEGHLRGDNQAYDAIKEAFSLERGDDEEDDYDEERDRVVDVRTYLVALTSCTSLLNRECSGLVKTVLSFEWIGREESFVKIYVNFLGSLASAQGAYIAMVLDALIKLFSGVKLSSGRLPGCPDVNRNQLNSRVHGALRYLLRLLPATSSILSPIFSTNFPASEDTKKMHTMYISNLLRVIEYAPELESDILALITDRLVKIDVQMQVDLDDMDDEVAAAVVEAISVNSSRFDDRGQEESDTDHDSITSDDDLGIDSKRIKDMRDSVEKLDAVLDLLFTVYSPHFTDPNSAIATAMFETLLGHFTTIILPTYRSRHTQFILFHFAQTADHLVDQFAGTCVQLAFQSSRPAVLRQASAAYLASFVARGAHVQPHVVRTAFDLIGNNLDHFRAETELICRGPDLKRYTAFYAMTQALLYIFCFRWRDLINSTDILEEDDPLAFINQDLIWIPGVKETLSRTIYSKLNPLKICSQSIVTEFARIAHHLKFMYVYPLLETNKRIRLSQFSSSHANGALRDAGNGQNNESWHQLDAYFPFDPYQLPVSKRWLEGDYVPWKGVPGLNGGDDEDEESSDEEQDESPEIQEDDTGTESDVN